MTQLVNNFRAGWIRVLVGLFGLGVVPWVLPQTEPLRWLFVAYVAAALLVQVLIKRDIGGDNRALVMGLVDLGVLTFFIHLVGSASTILVSVYFVIGTINALLVSRRVALALACAGLVGYCGVLTLEAMDVLAYAPASLDLAPYKPSARTMFTAALLVSLLLLTSTTVVARLAESLRVRERELLAANARLEELSTRDPLTELYNRRHLVARIENELRRVKRGARMALLMVDLDGFKRVNDKHGHLVGDNMLVAIARGLDETTRETDAAGRYGGDEFIIVLSDADIDHARLVADRLVKSVRDTSKTVEADHLVTASIGIALARREDGSRDLIRRADNASYRAKVAGGNRAVAILSAA